MLRRARRAPADRRERLALSVVSPRSGRSTTISRPSARLRGRGRVADRVRGGGAQLVRAALELVVGDRRDELGALAPGVERLPLGDAAPPDLDLPAGDAAVLVGGLDPDFRRRRLVVGEGERGGGGVEAELCGDARCP